MHHSGVELAAAVFADELPYAELVGLGGAGFIIAMFGVVYRGLTAQARGNNRLLATLQLERDEAVSWREYYRAEAAHWYAKALGDTNPPPRGVQPTAAPPMSLEEA